MARQTPLENTLEYKFNLYKDEILSKLDKGSDLHTIYQEYNINNRFQKAFNDLFVSKYGFTLKEYRQAYLAKRNEQNAEKARERNDINYKFRAALVPVITEIAGGGNINEVLRENRVYSSERKLFNELVVAIFGKSLLDIKQGKFNLSDSETKKAIEMAEADGTITKCLRPANQVKAEMCERRKCAKINDSALDEIRQEQERFKELLSDLMCTMKRIMLLAQQRGKNPMKFLPFSTNVLKALGKGIDLLTESVTRTFDEPEEESQKEKSFLSSIFKDDF